MQHNQLNGSLDIEAEPKRKHTLAKGLSGFARTLLAASALAAPAALVPSVVPAPGTACAQDLTSGAIVGQVKDSAGSPVAGAAVRITSARGYDRTLTTGANGEFRVNSASIGQYTVVVSKAGFGSVTNRGVDVRIGATAGVDVMLTAGASGSEDIVVTASRQRAIDFSENSTGITVDVQQTFDLLPVGRSSEAIQLLAPSATVGDSAFGSTVSLGGASVAENVFYVNGMNITNFRTFVGGSTIPFEAYEQLQVKTGGYSAEYGRATGGAVIAATRSGSNTFHGGFNFFSTPDQLRSQAPDTFQSLNSQDERRANEMNVWLSGPLIKDRLFFFAFYNARDFREYDVTAARSEKGGPRAAPTAIDSIDKSPYLGGKIDWNIVEGHRLELTYLSDEATKRDTQLDTSSGRFAPTGTARSDLGGLTKIAKYTGDYTDWLTLSVLYGQTNYSRTSLSDLDTQYGVYANLGADGLPTFDAPGSPGAIVRGNPNLQVESGADERKLFRADADIFFDLFGSHHVRVGYDQEKLNSTATTFYSGGAYYRYYRSGDLPRFFGPRLT